jgi:minor histocompatibility antigen H13
MELSTDLALAYSAIVTMAVTPIYIGCHLSVDQKGVETMSSEQAWKFPLIGSGVLFGLYMLFKLFSKEYINMLLTSYFLVLGILAVAGSLKPFLLPLFSKPITPKKFSWVPFWRNKDPIEVEVDKVDVLSLIFGTVVGIWYVLTKHWVSNNILGLAFSIQGISMLSLSSFKVGAILLGGLFFYDIFWVFGTDVMVTVAKSFDAPIKLLFPKQIFASELQFSMLGLGDIVIPGLFIALMLRFDAKRSSQKSKVYFWTCYVAYFIGLVTTIVIMHTFQSAQPALLYLVPACLGSVFLLAVIRGELSTLFAYEEEEKKEEKTEEKKNE